MALSSVDGVDLKKTEEELLLVSGVLKNEDIKKYFLYPKISQAEKKEKLKNAFAALVSKTVMNFLYLLIDKNRENHIQQISHAFTQIVDQEYDRVRPHVSLSRNYPEAELQKILTMVEGLVSAKRDAFGISSPAKLEFLPETEVKPEMLGGIYLRLGDYMWDSSISRFLRDWKVKVLSGTIEKDAVISADIAE
ncbi:MAG: ATP synthase F1 subunit delta [Spirochaetia bacterium]|nr:ATP synthase F1 subunit delta [Spirochaetia bacterium]